MFLSVWVDTLRIHRSSGILIQEAVTR